MEVIYNFMEMEAVKTKHVRTLNAKNLLRQEKSKDSDSKSIGCGECQASCQSACKTSCTVANQTCENK